MLTEPADPALGFSVPGMDGGVGIRPAEDRTDRPEGRAATCWRLVVQSRCRIVGHSGRTHRLTPEACVLVESGW
ncbi:hypothetical protein ACFXAF_36305 [Kitasatospora sp. NPDC059463]|uniref:hypothetical protein n=1 Tax=unclassified Kitasatospora TaxID=2633591 RepID=UPI003683486A